MRLISQDGMIDVPYDKCCLEVEISRREGSVVYFIYAHTCKITLSLASYSSKSKVLKVMEMLRNCYLGKDCGYHTEHDVCYHSRNDFETKVFKFPDDEEVEV